MKKMFAAGCLFFAIAAQAQKVTTKKPAPKKTTAPVTTHSTTGFKNLNDSVSYAIGLSVADFYKQQGMTSLNTTLLSKAINDVYGNKTTALTKDQANEAMMRFLNPKLYKNIEAGTQFLEENKKRSTVKTTASGLQYEVVTEGKGPKPQASDTVVVNYKGALVDGTEFDNSYKRNEPLTIPVNRVIPGWTEALQLMPVGSKYKLYIPYQLAYGMNDNGPIPGGSVLVFDVDLLSIKGK